MNGIRNAPGFRILGFGIWGFGIWLMGAVLPVSGVQAQEQANEIAPVVRPAANRTYAEIVRLRYVEGDVRVMRGDAEDWDQAEGNLPLESGFKLATGKGRAEIEFEDASTAWVGGDSAVTLDDLHTSGGVPSTQVTLLAGTLSVHLVPSPGGAFVVKTPTDTLRATAPDNVYLRVNAFLDATAVTPLKTETLRVDGAAAAQTGRGTVFYAHGEVVAPERTGERAGFVAWDQWVADRVAKDAAAVRAVQAASGLKGTIPGMADLYGQGTFFECKPYGMCWEPPADEEGAVAGGGARLIRAGLEGGIGSNAPPATTPQTMRPFGMEHPEGAGVDEPYFVLVLSPTSASVAPGGKVAAKVTVVGQSGFAGLVDVSVGALPAGIYCAATCAGQGAPGQSLAMLFGVDAQAAPGVYTVKIVGESEGVTLETELTIFVVEAQTYAMPVLFAADAAPAFPCTPDGVDVRTRVDPRTGRVVSIRVGPRYSTPYAWAVCHAGTWIYLHNVYVWVPTLRRHHHCPVRWVRCRKKEGWVPKHPLDVKGELPRNAKHEVYCPDKKDGRVERVHFDPKDGVEPLREAPEDFRRPLRPVLVKASEPRVPAYEWRARPLPGRTVVKSAVLAFEGKAGKVTVERAAPGGTKPGGSKMVRESLGSRRPAATVRSGAVSRAPAATRTGAALPHAPPAARPAATHATAAPARASSTHATPASPHH